jgi:hypothetical protein
MQGNQPRDAPPHPSIKMSFHVSALEIPKLGLVDDLLGC